MTDPLIAELEATNRLQADDIARLKGALERAKLLEDALNSTIDALESVVERQSRWLTEQAKTLEAVRELHRPMPVCPEAEGEWFPDHCPCDDWSRHYQVCEACCVDASDCTTEDCATCHDHGPDKPICPTMQALDGGAE